MSVSLARGRLPVVNVNARGSNSMKKLKQIKRNIHEFNYGYKRNVLHMRLDKQLHQTLSECGNDTTEFHCKILWKNLYDSLVELNEINEVYRSMRREYDDLYDEEFSLDDEFFRDTRAFARP